MSERPANASESPSVAIVVTRRGAYAAPTKMAGVDHPLAAGKYARYELERRFLVRELLDELGEGQRTTDRYVLGTRLRLRLQETVTGERFYKLSKKEIVEPPDCARMTITTIYLSEAEYEALAGLPALELAKTRYRLELDGRTWAIDVFNDGLVLAEVPFETLEELRAPLELPDWIEREVSDDERFSGGALAARYDSRNSASDSGGAP
jgi:CYTH domain-containing protein